MSQQYALPCQCGEHVPVETRQAGETVVCSKCGNPLEVPKLRDMQQLEIIQPVSAKRAKRAWSFAEGSLFAGGLLVIAIAAGAYGYTAWLKQQIDVKQPDSNDILFRHDIDDIPLTSSWDLWKEYQKKHVESRPTPYFVLAREKVVELDRWLLAISVVAGVGGASVVVSCVCRLVL